MNNEEPITIAQWLACYRSGATHRELLERSILRCHAMPSEIWIHLADRSQIEIELTRLDALERLYPDREELLHRYPLFGVPYAIKDNIDVAGLPTTAACPTFSRIAEKDAYAVTLLKEAGAVCLGKTNLDQFATGLVGTRSPYGRPASVFSKSHISGGSSSGSAVAVAAGAVPFSLGTDTAGSGRVPAAFNQIVGLKPTPGRISTQGVVPACKTLDCISIFAHTAADANHVLSTIEGEDPDDPYSSEIIGAPRWQRNRLRVGIPSEGLASLAVEYRSAWCEVISALTSAGHEVIETDFSLLFEIASLLYEGPWVAERYTVAENFLLDSPEALDSTVRKVIERGARFSAVDSFRAQYRLRELAKQANDLWSSFDLLVVPTVTHHPTFAEVDRNPIAVNSALGRYTNFVNLLGWAALALPAGSTTNGMPFGITLIADHGYDVALSNLGDEWQKQVSLELGGTGCKQEAKLNTLLRVARTESWVRIAVVGAHLSGLPLNWQLVERGAYLVSQSRTVPRYKLIALPDSVPSKPGLIRTSTDGRPIEVEIWAMPSRHLGSFIELIRHPLGIGKIELEGGEWVAGFLCETCAAEGATDISEYGGWRAYLSGQPSMQQELT